MFFGNSLEKALSFAVSALFFQNLSTCGIVFGNLLEKQRTRVLFAKEFTKTLTYFLF